MRYLDLHGVTPTSPPELARLYVKTLGVEYDVEGVDEGALVAGDTVITGPWGDWSWLPGSVNVVIVPDGGKTKREEPVVAALRKRGLSVGYRNKPPKTTRSRDWTAYHEAVAEAELWKRVHERVGQARVAKRGVAPYTVVESVEEARRVIARLHGRPYAWDLETDGLDPREISRIGIALADDRHSWWIIDKVAPAVVDDLVALLRDPTSEQRGSNLKFDAKVIWGWTARTGSAVLPTSLSAMHDTQIKAWMLHCGTRDTYTNDLKYITRKYLKREVLALDDVGGPELFWQQSYDTQATYAAAGDTRNSYDLNDHLDKLLRDAGLYDLYVNVEAPVIPVLAEMEIEGLPIDRKRLLAITREMSEWADEITQELRVFGFRGEPSNDNHIAQFLHDDLGLPVLVRTEKLGRPSVAVPVLQRLYLLRDTDERVEKYARVIELFMEFSQACKALDTFCLPPLLSGVSVLYGRIAQTSTVTGRLAGPTMQVPAHGRRAVIREAYVAPEGCILWDADYAQIEPRLGAHYSMDERMLRDFREGRDVYLSLAKDMGMEIDKRDPRRQTIKTIYLADMYIVQPPQIQSIALRQGQYIPLKVAREYQDGIHRVRPQFFQWRDELIQRARETREVRDFAGRRRVTHDLWAVDPSRRRGAEREVSNFPEQGGAGTILKLAMPRIQKLARSAGGSLINAVHDELIDYTADMPVSERVAYAISHSDIMESVTELAVPLVVEIGCGRSWKEAKGSSKTKEEWREAE